jgi:prephenate dehydrogenase
VRIAVLGVGLIGGSIGLAARERLGAHVAGYDPGPGVLDAALARGAVDVPAGSLAEALDDAEAAFVAAPVGVLPALVGEVLALAPAGCVVSDVGSTKAAVLRDDRRFCGGHPLAGAETAGVGHARADLFDGAPWYLTPTAATSGILLERLHRIVAALGGRPVAIDAAEHDRLMAGVSHLPHVLANVLVELLDEGEGGVPATGPSFRDATRVAGANSAIWVDIYRANRVALTERVDRVLDALTAVRTALAADDRGWLEAWNEDAAAARRRLLEAGLAGGPVHELRASVPNRPGVVAELALALGRAGVNIVDMALSPSPDLRQGRVSLYVAGDAHAERALELIGALGFPVARA